jgi:hypothetical protein
LLPVGIWRIILRMSTLTEIQNAVAKLPANERKALLTWLASEDEPQFSLEEEHQLLRSLDEATRDIDAGKGISIDDVRKRVNSWGTK